MSNSLTTTASDTSGPSWYAWYSLALLFLVYVFNFIDRSILGILNESIKNDLGLTDSHMGFLGGIAFALFYATLGVPLARYADRNVRTNLLVVCLTLWSALTALCGLVQNFFQLLIARIGVGVGEAGCSPACHSMLSDLFPPSSRATVLSIYALGVPIGTMLGNFVGGWLNEAYGWRTAFVVVGLPGVLLAVWLRMTLREPKRGASEKRATVEDVPPPIKQVISQLWAMKSFRFLCLAGSLHAFVGTGIGFWLPAFYIRTHSMGTADIGSFLLLAGVAGMIGTFLGGYVGDRLAKRDLRWYVWLPGIATLASVPFSAVAYLTESHIVSFAALSVSTMFGAYYFGPTFALTHKLVSLRTRALASSIVLFLINLIGMGLGPQVTGIVSDIFNAMGYGTESLQLALIVVITINVVATYYYWKSGRSLLSDADKSETMQQSQG